MVDVSLTQYLAYTISGLALIAIGAWFVDRWWKKGRRRRSEDGNAFRLPYALAGEPRTDGRRHAGRPPQLETFNNFHPVLTDDRAGAWKLLTALHANGDPMIVRTRDDVAPLSARGAALARVAFAATPKEVRAVERALVEDPGRLSFSPRNAPAVSTTRTLSFAGVFSPFRPSALALGANELELNDAGSSFFAALVGASARCLAAAELLMDLPVGEDG